MQNGAKVQRSGDAEFLGSPAGQMSDELILQKEIVERFSRFQFHRTEMGEKTDQQYRYIVNLKIARIRDLLMRLEEKEDGGWRPMPTATNIVNTVRNLTEFCIQRRMGLWFNYHHESFIQQLSSMALQLVSTFDAREAVVMVWMYGKTGRCAFKNRQSDNHARKLLTELVRQLLARGSCAEMTVHDTLLLLNGLANLDCTQLPEVLDACLPTFMHHLESMKHDNFALFVWCYGKLSYRPSDTAFIGRITKQCEVRFAELSVQQLSSVAWGLCRMDVPEARTFLMRCTSRLPTELRDFIPLGIARFVDACYLFNQHPGDSVLRMLANRFSHFRGYSTPALFLQALPAFAYFSMFPQMMFEYSFTAMQNQYSSLADPDEMIRILTAYSIADMMCPTFLEMTIAKLLKRDSYEDLPLAVLRETWIGIATHRAHYGEMVDKAVPKKLMALVKKAWIEKETSKPQHALATDILNTLKEQMNVTASCSYCEPETEIRADLVCLWWKKRVVLFIIDVNDVAHNDPRRLGGTYCWKERVFLKLGYGVGRIAAEKWKLLDTPTARQNYLLYVLKTHLSVRNGGISRDELYKLQGKTLYTA